MIVSTARIISSPRVATATRIVVSTRRTAVLGITGRVVAETEIERFVNLFELHTGERQVAFLHVQNEVGKDVIVLVKDPDKVVLRLQRNQDVFDPVSQIKLLDDLLRRVGCLQTSESGGSDLRT